MKPLRLKVFRLSVKMETSTVKVGDILRLIIIGFNIKHVRNLAIKHTGSPVWEKDRYTTCEEIGVPNYQFSVPQVIGEDHAVPFMAKTASL